MNLGNAGLGPTHVQLILAALLLYPFGVKDGPKQHVLSHVPFGRFCLATYPSEGTAASGAPKPISIGFGLVSGFLGQLRLGSGLRDPRAGIETSLGCPGLDCARGPTCLPELPTPFSMFETYGFGAYSVLTEGAANRGSLASAGSHARHTSAKLISLETIARGSPRRPKAVQGVW